MKLREEIENDYEIAGVIVDEVLPYSLEYFLGIEHEGDDDFGGSDEEGSDEEGSDEEAPKKKKEKKSGSKSKSRSKGKDKKDTPKAEEKPECKNQ
jgi:nucleosome assembly protein 1-like 1